MAKLSKHLWLIALLVAVGLGAQTAKPAIEPRTAGNAMNSAQVGSFILAENKKTDYRIATSKGASEVEEFAAQELQKYLNRITGARFPIVEGISSGKVILVGSKLMPTGLIDRQSRGKSCLQG